MTSNTDWEKEFWQIIEKKGVGAQVDFPLALREMFRKHLFLAEERGYSRGIAEEGVNCYDHCEKARKEGQEKAVEFLRENIRVSDQDDDNEIQKLLEQAKNL